MLGAINYKLSAFYDADFLPLTYHLLDIVVSLLSIYVILLAECFSESIYRKIAHFTGLFPYPGGGLVEADEFAKVDSSQTFAYDDVFATDGAQYKSFFLFHILLFFDISMLRCFEITTLFSAKSDDR